MLSPNVIVHVEWVLPDLGLHLVHLGWLKWSTSLHKRITCMVAMVPSAVVCVVLLIVHVLVSVISNNSSGHGGIESKKWFKVA